MAFDESRAMLDASGASRGGLDRALYSAEFCQADAGEVVAFIPVCGGEIRPTGRVHILTALIFTAAVGLWAL